MEANLGLADDKLLKRRNAFLKHWVDRAKSLAQDEERLRSQMHPHIQDVLKGKRLLVYKEMLQAVGFASLGSPCVSMRSAVLGGWGGLLLWLVRFLLSLWCMEQMTALGVLCSLVCSSGLVTCRKAAEPRPQQWF